MRTSVYYMYAHEMMKVLFVDNLFTRNTYLGKILQDRFLVNKLSTKRTFIIS